MSHLVQPKQILKKEMSAKEHELLEEWAPQTLQGYHYPDSSSLTVSDQPEKMPNTVHDPGHRRAKNRSSSLFEEWKARASRPGAASEPTTPVENEDHAATKHVIPASDAVAGVPDDNVGGGKGNTQNGVVAPVQVSGNRDHHVQSGPNGSIRTRRHIVDRNCDVPNNGKAANSSSEAKKTVESQTASRSTVRSSPRRRNNVKSTNANSPTTSGIRQAPKAANEPTKPADKQHVSDPKVEGYTAPNGTHLRKDELDKLSMGVKVPDKDTVYFHPSFVEDPWKGLKPVMMECSGRW